MTISESQRSRLKLIYLIFFCFYHICTGIPWSSLGHTSLKQCLVVKSVRDFSPLVKIITNLFLKLLSAKYIFYFNMSIMVPPFTQIMTGTDFELTFIKVQGCCSLDCKKTCVYHILFWLSPKKLPVNKELNWPWIKILGQISRSSWHVRPNI